VRVRVEWSPAKLASLPASGMYSTVARFKDDYSWPAGDAWSIVLRLPSLNEMRGGPFEAEARLLVPDAPACRLKSGASFELFEGAIITATVLVL
jgi:hypothetical protein